MKRDSNPIGFVFKGGRSPRLQSGQIHPDDLFYGCTRLPAGPVVLEQDDFGYDPHAFIIRMLDRASSLLGFSPGLAFAIARGSALARLNECRAVVATTNTYGYVLGLLAHLRLLKAPVLFLAMGLLPAPTSRWRRFLASFLLSKTHIYTISRGEQSYLSMQLRRTIGYLPFGVDMDFWGPAESTGSPFVFSMGNDENRDYELLSRVWREDFPELVIVTSRPVPARKNIRVLRGDWRGNIISDRDLLELYQKCMFVIVPSRNTIQPAGQSVTLQAMACGKAVVLPRIDGLWDAELMNPEVCLLYEPGNSDDLLANIQRLLASPATREQIGTAARVMVSTQLTSEKFASALLGEIDRISASN